MVLWRKVVLFGDSLTQRSFHPHGWGSSLADALQRKADVVNRGFSGYNTDNAVDMLHLEFPKGSMEERDAVTICFGANDSSLEGFDQHVPLERFQKNMNDIVHHFISLGIPKNNILVISPPPVDAKAWLAHVVESGKGDKCDRNNEVTRLYAEVCGKIATDNSCLFVDLWEKFIAEKNFENLLCDGLHFSEAGNRLVFTLVWERIGKRCEEWKMNYPDWKEFYNNT